MNKFRTGWISDLHLGTRGCNADAVLQFLRDYEFETLYIVGDLLDIWSLRRSRYWPQSHNDVVQKILRKGRKGTRIIYIPGNHDELLREHIGEYGSLTITRRALHRTADGRKLLIIHGDELDTVIQNVKWLAYIGDVGYQFLLRLNQPVNFLRRRFGLGYWSLSAYAKREIKNAVSFVGKFEEAIVRYARQYQVDGVLCGHIHWAAKREIDGICYYNCGDFVESCTALVEHFDGSIELLSQLYAAPGSAPEDPAETDEPRPEAGLFFGRETPDTRCWASEVDRVVPNAMAKPMAPSALNVRAALAAFGTHRVRDNAIHLPPPPWLLFS
jgi:UDP-2,3-diacylglucosamine pyrophosphatase LpxH